MSHIPLDLCCPSCRRPLITGSSQSRCERCSSVYPVVAGIPDLRLCPDPYISIDEDREKALLLAAKAEESSFGDLLSYYYSITPEVPEDLARRYTEHHLRGIDRARGALQRVSTHFPDLTLESSTRVVDLGCGTGGLVAVGSQSGASMVGVDIALRWLVIARRQLQELGIQDAPLICAGADHLPFVESSFDLVVAEGLLEHVADAGRALAEICRVASGGYLAARTVNRWVLAPEPHVQVWGVGFLPRRWMDGYVRWRRDLPYEHIYLRSWFEWRRLARRQAGDDLAVGLSRMSPLELEMQPTESKRLLSWFDLLSRWQIFRPLLTLFGPFLDIVGSPRMDSTSP